LSKNILIIGGGAAGFFAAINCARLNPGYNITILEKSSTLLNKVKISGGGRCNVTHACFDARELVKNYPRGEKQLLGPFTRFNPSNTIDWFKERGVQIKREDDGRMFPSTDSSQTIIDCFMTEAKRLGVKILLRVGVDELHKAGDKWNIITSDGEKLIADAVVVTTGSSHQVWQMLEKLGHKIVTPVPSLFTFNIKDERIKGLEGLSMPTAAVRIINATTRYVAAPAPLLITHWGMSGPAILKLSAFAARELAALSYKFELEVNWLNKDFNAIKEALKQFKQANPKKNVLANPLFAIPKRLWEKLSSSAVGDSAAGLKCNYADLSNLQLDNLARSLTASRFLVSGKSTFKDEFVTSGGVDLSEIDFKTMQRRKVTNLYFAGEVLDIDAITGGFNFQAAWTTAFIVSQTI
jgi:hypothetical protein